MPHVRLAAVLVSGGLSLSTGALAQAPSAPAPAAPAPAPAAPAPAPAAAAPAPESLLRIYGVLNTRFLVASGAVESYSQPNGVAITAAGNPVLSNAPDNARYTFQAAQSRFGFWVNEKGRFRGQLEFDFVDFSKATPTVASLPRLRIARADWSLADGHMLSLGQDWDLHAPLNPHGINMVGALFQAGNSGFMRQQLKYVYSTGPVELGAAVGFPANNNAAKESVGEFATPPTLAVRGALKVDKSRVGLSAITTELPFAFGTERERRSRVFGVGLFAELNPLPTTNVRVELNYGQNSANIGLLTLAQGHAAADLQEAGGFVSVRHALSPEHALIAVAGTQRVLSAEGLLPSYTYPASAGSTPAPSTATPAGTGPGMRYNGAARLGYEFKPASNVSLVLEGFTYQSRHVLHALDAGRGTPPVRRALGVETGAMVTF